MEPLALVDLERGMRMLPAPPLQAGWVRKVVVRMPGERRVCPASVHLEVEGGVIGDRWGNSAAPKLEAQVTVMRADVAELMCRGEGIEVLGDNLFVALDTSAANLPAGTILRVGGARCEVTPKAHTGCSKFSRRVGEAALVLTKSPAWKAEQLRGVHLRVLESGEVSVGDSIVVEARP